MIATGSDEYHRRLNEELNRVTEELQALHHGDRAYLTWLEASNREWHKFLAQMPAYIDGCRGIVPFQALKAYIDLYLAAHKFFFESWACREQTGVAFLPKETIPWTM
jgi:hypothetical protein